MSVHPGSLRVGFAGTPAFALPALEALLRSPHQILAVFTQPDRPSGRGQALAASAVKQCALGAGLPVLQPPTLKSEQALAALRALALDALIVVAYGLILPEAALAAPRLGCYNIHASLLPRWRGAAPIQRAILAGDARTGVTLMRMQAGLDTGPMLAQRALEIGPLETAGELHDRLAQLGAGLLMETLAALARGEAHETPQPDGGVTYAAKIEKREALINWNAEAEAVVRQVRAFNPWPVAETRLEGAQLRIWEAEPVGSQAVWIDPARPVEPAGSPPGTVLSPSERGIEVACGRGAVRLTRLQLPGRKPVTAREFLNAHPLAHVRLGTP